MLNYFCAYIGQDQSLGPKRAVRPPTPPRPPPESGSLPRPQPRPPPPAPPPDTPVGRALPQRLHMP
ncbi:hypothetical protein Hanom_Chr03g00187621 [Helianthus anomalus]